MKALAVTDHGVRIVDRPSPMLREGEALVGVELAGICNTDLEIARGYMGFRGVLGHEVLGRVRAVAPGAALTEQLSRQRVALEINCGCGSCTLCQSGVKNHCSTRTVLGILGRDGGLAEEVAIPIANLRAIPDAISDEAAVFVEPLAAALHAFDSPGPKPGDRVAILGDGKLGLLCALAIAPRRSELARVLVIGKHPSKLAIAEAVGLEIAIASEKLSGIFDFVVEATGAPEGLARALAMLRPLGTLVLKSTHAAKSPIDLAPIVINEVTVIGSRCGDFDRAIALLASGAVDPRPLISKRFPLSDGERAFTEAAAPGVLKVLVMPENA
jgi:threonine dehydrogenase-like Zn-dependent dehydrogenase